ncbi:serine/threonine protein kinase [Amycolatopsis arida]|uniref:non-specific serine/threonine protein kinase n=1 Tax=Amycolatopsis arida TaxID=587909 RepID=A0A1I5TW17_9PSEU|nr:Stk1 family PASTA domain-containing Ser/Thr kinase [Amycolatopsis arida]TDX95943.1 serine/threonine-protein kinase [Amycolatopsis arida]SFP87243.1 serine/threonine protein kinase [Amycolatopsis arida]
MSAPRLLSNRYELGDTLGYGGMSEVHHGHDVRLGREVAVKILRADLARDPQFQERFRREAQNAAALNHPAIVAVYDTGETQTEYGPLPYIVMEYVEGRTLRDIVKTEGPMSQKRAMEVMADVCAALDFSHRHGIVHRDVKPANVMITKNGAVKVMDFGIARAMHDGQSAMTQTAAVIGTAQYLSPEQARGESVDARSDVYAAGCVLYELVTGEPPFTGDSPVAVAYQHVREDPQPPSAINPAVSPELDAVVLKALAKGPANRYQSAAEMRSDLVRTLSGQRPSAPMVMSDDERTQVLNTGQQAAFDDYDPDAYAAEEDERRRRKRRNVLIAAAVGAVVLAIALVMLLTDVFKGSGDEVPMPGVVGLRVQEAKEVLRENQLENFDEEPVFCYPTPQQPQPACNGDQIDKVVSTDPEQGELVRTSQQVVLRVGKGPQQVVVPDLAGKTRAEAEQLLNDKGLLLNSNVAEVEVQDPDLFGKVVEQDPPSGSPIEQGRTVSIKVGKTLDMASVPNVEGKPYDQARSTLRDAGFEVQRKDVDSDKPEGQVVRQQPNGGLAPKGSTVVLEVSNGSQQEITMPDLVGMTEDQALAALRDRGWSGQVETRKEEVSDPDDAGRVTNTNPSKGSKITKKQKVVLYIGESDKETTSPGGGIIGGRGNG